MKSGWLLGISVILLASYQPQESIAQPLDTSVEEFQFQAPVTMFGVINEIGLRAGVSGLYLGDFDAKTGEQKPAKLFAMERRSGTTREILDEAVKRDPVYVWFPIGDSYVNVLPAALVQDEESFLYQRIGPFEFEAGTKLSAAWRTVQDQLAEVYPMPDSRRLFDFGGGFTGGMVGVFPLRVDAPIPVQLDLPEGTWLDVVNSLIRSQGDAIWMISSTQQCMPLGLDQRLVVTIDLARARAYLSRHDKDRNTLCELFDRASKRAPYDRVRERIELERAYVYLGKNGPFSGYLRDFEPEYTTAESILRSLVLPSNKHVVPSDIFENARAELQKLYTATGRDTVYEILDQEILRRMSDEEGQQTGNWLFGGTY